mgnify:FL=1|tara:strand:- start:661 stop:942 length:282 start_codon:yes stop_codon:yes gene_type:complete
MTREKIEDYISITAPDYPVVLADNLDEAFVGVDTENEPPRAVYSIEKCIDILKDGMSYDEAAEYFWYNVAGAGGEGYPIYISTPMAEEDSPYE